MTTNEISEKTGCASITVRKWAAENNVKFIGEGRRKTYVFTEEDYERFLKRAKPGKRAKVVDNS